MMNPNKHFIAAQPAALTYSSTQATNCAVCGKHRHTPLRIDAMGGYICLTCVDHKLCEMLGEFGRATPLKPLAMTEFEAWLQRQPDARFWNTLDAMQAAWVAAKATPSPVWCASVDDELAATAEADAALSDVHVQAVRDAVAEALGNAYDCTRVWSAWGVGTMDQDDFQLVAEDSDRVAEIADAAIAAMRAPAPAITLPAAAVAEGLERDGDALEQAS